MGPPERNGPARDCYVSFLGIHCVYGPSKTSKVLQVKRNFAYCDEWYVQSVITPYVSFDTLPCLAALSAVTELDPPVPNSRGSSDLGLIYFSRSELRVDFF